MIPDRRPPRGVTHPVFRGNWHQTHSDDTHPAPLQVAPNLRPPNLLPGATQVVSLSLPT